jgi:hypothetical protein
VHGCPALSFVKAVYVPLAKVSGIIAVFPKRVCNGRHLGWHLVLVAWHALVGIEASQHGAAKRAAEGKAGHSPLIVLPFRRKAVQVWRVEIRVAVAA